MAGAQEEQMSVAQAKAALLELGEQSGLGLGAGTKKYLLWGGMAAAALIGLSLFRGRGESRDHRSSGGLIRLLSWALRKAMPIAISLLLKNLMGGSTRRE